MIHLSETESENGIRLEDCHLSTFLPTTKAMMYSALILGDQLGKYLARSFQEVMSANVTSQFLETDVTNSEMKPIPKSIGVFLDLTFVDMPGQELSMELSSDDIDKLMRDLWIGGRRHSMFWQEDDRGALPEEYVSSDMMAILQKFSIAIIECLEKISASEEVMRLLYPQSSAKMRLMDIMTYSSVKDQIFHLIFDETEGCDISSSPVITKGNG